MSQPPASQPPLMATVVSILNVPAPTPQNPSNMNALITYRTDPLHSFTIEISADDAKNPDKVDAAVRQDYSKRKALINRQVSL